MQYSYSFLVFTLTVVAVAILWPAPSSTSTVETLCRMYSAVDINCSAPQAILLGVNVNLDLIVSATAALHVNGENDDAVLSTPPVDHPVINSREELLQTFAHYFEQGKASERFVADSEAFQAVVKAAAGVPGARWAVGGNAALMAQAAAERGARVQLAGLVGAHLRRLLGDGISVAENQRQGEQHDEVHLILEYKTGESFHHLKAPRSNRFIISNDVANAELKALEDFQAELRKRAVDVVVISGPHLLVGLPDKEQRKERIAALVAVLAENSLPVHLEFASVSDHELVAQLLVALSPHVDSIGFNEEELYVMYSSLAGDAATLAREHFSHSPAIADVQVALAYLFGALDGRVSRLHFHCLGFHLIATRQGASLWPAAAQLEAVVSGSIATSLRACGSDVLEADLYTVVSAEAKMPYSWTSEAVEFFVAPVLVCKSPVQTVGCGDSISATALLKSVAKSSNQ